MLPIDDAAKSGEWVYCTNRTLQEFQKVRWQSGVWVNASGFGGALEEAYTHYIPASWVEHAWAMREALIHADAQAAAASEIANVIYDSDVVDEALAATEWPKEG